MIRREHDPAIVNRIASDPSVRPFVCHHDREIDFSPVMDACVVLTNGEDAMAIFEQTAEREWQAHTFVLPTGRGRKAIETGKKMLAYMLANHADRIWGATPLNNRAARWFNRQIGAVPIGNDDFEADGPVEIFEVRAGQWQ